MTDKLIPSTPEEYYEHTTKVVEVPSGQRFRIQAMSAASTIFFYTLLPDDGLETEESTIGKFMLDNFVSLQDNIIDKCIVEPKLDPDRISFRDQTALLVEIMKLSGLMSDDEETPVSPPKAEDPPAA